MLPDTLKAAFMAAFLLYIFLNFRLITKNTLYEKDIHSPHQLCYTLFLQ